MSFCILDFINSYSSLITAFATIVLVCVTVVYAIISNNILKQQKEANILNHFQNIVLIKMEKFTENNIPMTSQIPGLKFTFHNYSDGLATDCKVIIWEKIGGEKRAEINDYRQKFIENNNVIVPKQSEPWTIMFKNPIKYHEPETHDIELELTFKNLLKIKNSIKYKIHFDGIEYARAQVSIIDFNNGIDK